MTFKKSMSLILVLTMVLGLFSTGVFVNQAQASAAEAELRPITSVAPDDLIPADGKYYLGSKPSNLAYYLTANLDGTDYYFKGTGTQDKTYGIVAETTKANATPVTLAEGGANDTFRIAFWSSTTSSVQTYYMCLYIDGSYKAGARTRLSDTTATRLKDLTMNADGTISVTDSNGTELVYVCYTAADNKVYTGFIAKNTVTAAEAGTYAYVYLQTSAGVTISSVANFPAKDMVVYSRSYTASTAPAILKYYLAANVNGTDYYFQNTTGNSGFTPTADRASAAPVTLAVGDYAGTYRIAYWNATVADATNYMCIYFNGTSTTGRTRLNKVTYNSTNNYPNVAINENGIISVTKSSTEYVLVCDATPTMKFVAKSTVDAAAAGTYSYVYLSVLAAPLSNETPAGYQVLDNLPQNAGDQVNNLYAGVSINGKLNVIYSNNSLIDGMRYFPVTTDVSKYATSSVINGSDIENSEGYMVVFGKAGSSDTFSFVWDSTNGYFSNNKIQSTGTPDGGFAAKHTFSYDTEEDIFTHTYSGVKYILGMKATDSGVRTYTYTEASMAAATNDPIYPVRLYEDVSTIRYSVQLNSILRVKFYVPTGSNTVKIAVGNAAEAVVAPSGTQNVNGTDHNVYYVDVMAQDMLKPITASVYNEAGNKVDAKVFSMEAYVAKVSASGAEANVVNLAKAALVYCQYAAANKYPDVYTATANVTVPEGALSDYTITKAEGSDANIGLNAYLDEACALQLLIPVSAEYTVTIDGTVTALSTTKTIGDIEYNVYKIDKILPQDYGTSHTFVVKNGDATVYEAEASVLAYINHCLTTETGTEAELNLMSAMFHYWYDAVTYTTGSTPESLQLEAFTIVADSANAELANTLAANIQTAHGVTLAVNTDGSYTGNRAIYLGTDTSYNSYGGYRYNISIQNGSIYVNGTKEALATGANALVSSIQNTNMFPFGLEEATGYEWYTSYNTDNSVLRTPLGYTLKSYERMADLAPGVEMYKLTYTSSNTVTMYCINCNKFMLLDGEACNDCGTVKPNYQTAVAYAVVLRSGSDAKFQMVTAGYDPTKTYSTTDPAPTMTVQNLAAKLESDHSEYQVLAITNGGFARHDEGAGTEVPWGMQIVDGIVKHAPMTAAESGHARSQRWFGVNSSGKYKVGDAGDSNADRTDYTGIQQGVNGSHYIFKNGRPTPFLLTATQDDHTMVCHTKNDDMILLTMTNCNAAMATQAFMDLSQIAGNLDIYEGINLDGGGSTGMYYAAQGSSLSAAYVSNKDGQAREVSDAVAIVIPKN